MAVDQNILSILENLIPFPTFILDDEGRIVDFNQKGKKFLPDATFNTSILEILDKEFASVLERLLYEAKNFDKGVKENVLADKNENADEYTISVTPFKDEIQKTFICTIRLVTDSRSNKETQRFTIVTEEVDKIVRDDELFEIIKSVKSAFPFTFIGKAKIQKQIDMLEGFFWIKDNSRRFILVNKKFASLLGVKTKQLEGRFEKDVLPHFQNKLYSTIDNYVFETTNSVIIDGVSSASPYGSKPYEIVEFPILDIDNNVVAIMGVSQHAIIKSTSGSTEGKFDLKFIKDLNLPFIITSKDGKVQTFNDSVLKYLYDSSDIIDKYIPEIISETSLIDELKKFLENDKNAKTKIKVTKDSELLCLRSYNENGKTSQILFVFNDYSTMDSQTAGIIKMYDAIMKISPQAMFIYDLENLKFLEVNDAAVKLYGYSREDFMNMDLTDLYAPEDIQTLLETANKKSDTNEFTGPWRHKKKDGSSIIVELSNSPLEYKGKSAHINIVRNVTDEVKNNKKIKLFKTAFDNSSDLIFVTDKDGFITYASESVIRSLGYSKSDLEKKPFLSLLKDEYRAEFNKTIIHSDSKEPKKYKTEVRDSGDNSIEISMVATPIYEFSGELESIAIVGKVKTQAVTQSASLERVQKSGIEPSFLSNVFHELLTPINVILGFLQEINDSLENPTDEQKEAIDIIKENQKVLLQTMDTAAEYSAFEDNKIQLKPQEITFVDLLEEIQSTTDRTARSNNLELTYGKISSSLKLITDTHHFSILVTQFIKYAMQISKENKIFLSAYTFDNNNCIISIKDKREGISSHLLNGLQDIFTKDEDAIRKSLGFSRITTKLFRKLIDSLDARNEVISKDDKPTEFGLVFPNVLEVEIIGEVKDEFTAAAEKQTEQVSKDKVPLQPEKEVKAKVDEQEPVTEREAKEVNINVNVTSPTAEKETEEHKQEKQKPVTSPAPEQKPVEQTTVEKKPLNLPSLKCLYVEDQVDSQILFKVQMKELQEIDFATSFEEALPKIKSKDYDFIVMDINLDGEYNGLDALRVIQKLPAYHNKPIIAVTAYVLPGDRDKFIAAGFSDFISKPVLKDKLVDVLGKIF